MLEFLLAESGNPDIAFDPVAAASEAEHGDRNAALAHYFQQCAIRMSCRDLALAAAFLARHGLRRDGTRLLPARGEAGQRGHAHLRYLRHGGQLRLPRRPAGQERRRRRIVAVIPGRCTLCVWSPLLETYGNSAVSPDSSRAGTVGWRPRPDDTLTA
jgi:glutaminase